MPRSEAAPAPVPIRVASPAPPPAPTTLVPKPAPAVTTSAAFDRILFNFDQIVFSDADSTGLTSFTTDPAPGSMLTGVKLNVSLDAPTLTPAVGGVDGAGNPPRSSGLTGQGEGSDLNNNDEGEENRNSQQQPSQSGAAAEPPAKGP